jgi:cystathionine beta-lyase
MLPLGVADMDFRAPPVVLDALHEAVSPGIFGYPTRYDIYVAAVTAWQSKRFGWEVSREWVVQTPGIIASIKISIQAFSHPGDSVLIQPPVHAHLHEDVLVNGRRLTQAPLKLAGDRYRFDATAFEEAILANTMLFTLCSPHHPTGNVWSDDDLRTMGEICLRRGVLTIADEIHEDLVLDRQKKHVPFASLSEELAVNLTQPPRSADGQEHQQIVNHVNSFLDDG